MASMAAQGLWINMMCIMHQGEPYGYYRFGANEIPDEIGASMTGLSKAEYQKLIKELSDLDIFSVSKDGCIYSRRMVEDEKKREKFSNFGKKGGGNPNIRMVQKDA